MPLPANWNLHDYIGAHLSYELATLAKAAATWRASRLEPSGPGSRTYDQMHLEEMSQVAALVHQRSICEFLLLEEGWGKDNRTPHKPPVLLMWEEYKDAIHERVLHPDPRRP